MGSLEEKRGDFYTIVSSERSGLSLNLTEGEISSAQHLLPGCAPSRTMQFP